MLGAIFVYTICEHVCVCVLMRLHAHLHIVFMCACLYVCMCVCVCVCVAFPSMCAWVRAILCLCVCVCVGTVLYNQWCSGSWGWGVGEWVSNGFGVCLRLCSLILCLLFPLPLVKPIKASI